MGLGWDAYLDREIERHMGGEADPIEEEPAAPTTGDTACDICGARFDLCLLYTSPSPRDA